MENRLSVPAGWDISNGDFVSKEEGYERRHKEAKLRERKFAAGILAALLLLAIPAAYLIFTLASKIKL